MDVAGVTAGRREGRAEGAAGTIGEGQGQAGAAYPTLGLGGRGEGVSE